MQSLKTYKNTITALMLVLLSIVLSSLMLYNGHNWGGDFSEYIAQSIALTQGKEAILEQIKNNTFIISNSDWTFGPYIYPWGYPLLLTPIYALFGENLIAFKMINVIAFGIFVGVFFRFATMYLSFRRAIFASAIFALNPLFLAFNNNILSDITFLLFSFLGVTMLSRLFFAKIAINAPNASTQNILDSIVTNTAPNTPDSIAKNALDSITRSVNYITPPRISTHQPHTRDNLRFILYITIASFFALFASLIRNNGIVIILSLFCAHCLLLFKHLFPRHKIAMQFLNALSFNPPFIAHLLPYVIVISGNVFVGYMLGVGGSGHIEALEGLGIKSIVRNVLYYMEIFNEFFAMPSAFKPYFEAFKYEYLIPNIAGLILFVGFVPLIFRGMCASAQQSIFFLIFVLGSLALLIIWPHLQGIRFVFCVLPFFALWAFKAESKKIFSVIVIALLGYFILKDGIYIYRNLTNTQERAYEAYSQEALEMYEFIKSNTKPSDIIIFFKPRVLYLNTARLSFATIKEERLKEANFLLESNDGKLFKDSQISSMILQGKVKLLKKNANFRFYEIRK